MVARDAQDLLRSKASVRNRAPSVRNRAVQTSLKPEIAIYRSERNVTLV